MDMSDTLIDYYKHLAAESQKVYQQLLSAFSDWCAKQEAQFEHINNKRGYEP